MLSQASMNKGNQSEGSSAAVTVNVAFDTIIKGGRVVDPSSGIDGVNDVAIRGGTIAEVGPNLDASGARSVFDASGQIVTPGLVDLHTHIYWGVTFWGIEADPVAARTGVTTWLDVGSSGSYSFPGFRRYICEPSNVRIFALLNVSSIGLIARTGELANLDYLDVDLAREMVETNRDIILGIKARIDKNTTRGTGIRPLQLARELADEVDLPLMVHIGGGPPSLEEIAALLRPGDILTHCFTGSDHRILGADNLVRSDIKDLHDRGLILDIGHGTGSFNYDVAEAMLGQGIMPDVISSDIHQLARQGPMFDMPTTLSKFLNLGMNLSDVIERATSRPAAAMRRPELGTLKSGSQADIAVFQLESGDYTFHDAQMNARRGEARLISTLTMVDGVPLPRIPERDPIFWAKLPDHQRRILAPQPEE
jgi:dihydroorotase